MNEKCTICGCALHRGRNTYAKDTIEGRSHATKHHFVAERFFGRTGNRRGEQREKLFKTCPWGLENKTSIFCYECHELLLHNPILLPHDIERFAELARSKGLSETDKPTSKDKIAGRLKLLQQVIDRGLTELLCHAQPGKLLVQPIQDDIFSFAPTKCQMAILWMKSGFSGLFTDWWSSFSPSVLSRKTLELSNGQWKLVSISKTERIWKSDSLRLFRLEPPIGMLAYMYIHPNKNDSWVSSPSQASSLTKQALETAMDLGVQVIGMNGIQGGTGRHDRAQDKANAYAMIDTIEQWSSKKPHSFQSIYLVDKENGFQTAHRAERGA